MSQMKGLRWGLETDSGGDFAQIGGTTNISHLEEKKGPICMVRCGVKEVQT